MSGVNVGLHVCVWLWLCVSVCVAMAVCVCVCVAVREGEARDCTRGMVLGRGGGGGRRLAREGGRRRARRAAAPGLPAACTAHPACTACMPSCPPRASRRYEQPWEDPSFEYPASLAPPLQILVSPRLARAGRRRYRAHACGGRRCACPAVAGCCGGAVRRRARGIEAPARSSACRCLSSLLLTLLSSPRRRAFLPAPARWTPPTAPPTTATSLGSRSSAATRAPLGSGWRAGSGGSGSSPSCSGGRRQAAGGCRGGGGPQPGLVAQSGWPC